MHQFMLRFLLIFIMGFSLSLKAENATTFEQNQAFAALADVIENPKQREELIKTLRTLSQAETSQDTTTSDKKHSIRDKESETSDDTGQADQIPVSDANLTAKANNTQVTDAKEDPIKSVAEGTKAAVVSAVNLPGKIALQTSEIAVEVGESLKATWKAVVRVVQGRDYSLKRFNLSKFTNTLNNLLIVIATIIVLFLGLRYVSRPLKRKLNNWAISSHRYQPIVRTIITGLTVVGMDVLFLNITYIVANSVAIYMVGELGILSMQASLVLNAFFIIGAIKIILRLIFYPSYRGLRLLPSQNKTAHAWYRWLANIVSLVGYGFMVCIPLVNVNLSYALGQALSTLIAISAFIYGVTFVWHNRHKVAQALINMAEEKNTIIMSTLLRVLGHTWHWLAIAYFIMLLVVTVLQAEQALPFVLKGTLWTIIAVGGGLLASNLLTQLIGHRIRLSPEFNRKLPGVEKRLNAFIPLFLRVIRFTLTVFVIMLTLSAWDFFDLQTWVNSEQGSAFLNQWLGIVIIIILAFLLWLVSSGIIEHRLSSETGSSRPTARMQTLLSLFKNALAITIIATAVMMVLSEVGINIGPLIAGAGVLGLAIGFGAQSLVQDVITGIFIQIENAMNTGDVVTLSGITGTVEHISIRSVGLRDISGTYHLIPFSSATTVSNFNRGYAFHMEDYGIGYREDIDEAILVLEQAFEALIQSEHKRSILEPIKIVGVTKLDNSSVNIRVRIKTIAGEQWSVGRAYNRLVKIYFDRHGIEMPFPHLTMYFGQGKNGEAPPVNLRLMREDFDKDGCPKQVEKHRLESERMGEQHKNTGKEAQDSQSPETSFGDTSEIRVAPRALQKSFDDFPNIDNED